MSAEAAPKAHQVEAISFCGTITFCTPSSRAKTPACAAEGEQHEVARVEAFLHGRLADDVGHLELGDPGDAARSFHERKAERRCDALHRVHRLLPVELDAPAEKIIRVDRPE